MKKVSKYRNKKTFRLVNGEKVIFDSHKEARRFDELHLMLKSGKISELILQPKYDLIPSVRWNGKTLRKITYSADFRYVENGKTIVEDVKASAKFQDDVYKIKKRLFLLQNKDLEFREIY